MLLKKALKIFLPPEKKKRMIFILQFFRKHFSDEMKNIQRQALAGMLWSKQYYHFDVERWLSTSDGITASQSR